MLDRVKPDGIVCANDVTAARLMRSLISLGVKVPGDIKMVGVDDVRYAKFLPTPLTTIRQNCTEIGAVAMATMLDRIKSPNQSVKDILVRFDLVVRASTGGTSTEDEE
jgi:DNA-binding LacI/PurR family transcriptional regulator